MNNGVQIIDVSKVYGGKGKRAVDNISIEIERGKIVGFIGPNGAGKTTTINMLTGSLSPSTGTITINGLDISTNSIEAKKQFGFVPDNPDVYLSLKGIEYLNFMADIYEVPQELRVQRIENLAKRFELENALGDKIASYSHGMRQKIVVIGALIHDPYLWILDEPLTGLDPQSAFELKVLMKEHVNNGNSVFFSTHVLEVAEKLCDKVVIINLGKIIFTGTIEEIKEIYGSNRSLEEIFLEMTRKEDDSNEN
ncbi:MAG: ABC transporter ATP-binding protein [Mycoplasmatales bacterium]